MVSIASDCIALSDAIQIYIYNAIYTNIWMYIDTHFTNAYTYIYNIMLLPETVVKNLSVCT